MADLSLALEQARALHHLLMTLVNCPTDDDWASPADLPEGPEPVEVEVRGRAFLFPAEAAFRGLHGVIAWKPVPK